MKKGSITLYLCLVLLVMLSLISAALFSVRNAAGRTVLASAAEQGMYSLFSRYDRTLFDKYGVLALDGGYGGRELKLGALQKEAEDIVKIVIGDSGRPAGPSNLTGLSLKSGEVTGYTLLTDNEGAFFREQIARALKGKMGESFLENTESRLNQDAGVWDSLEGKGNEMDTAEIERQYMELPGSAEEIQNVLQSLTEPLEETFTETAQSGENPIELIRGIRKMGIHTLVVPKGKEISAAEMEQDCVSKRTLQQGMGVFPEVKKDLKDKLILLEYTVDSFTNFVTAGEDAKGLKYQAEYAIGGKNSDLENLKAVLDRLLAVREIANYLYLKSDSVKREEIQVEAIAISTLLSIPAGEKLVEEMLTLCWAFGESVLDLRELLKGGKVPLMKDSASWQLSFAMLTHLQDDITEERSNENGMDYSWYLRLLLLKKNENQLTKALMDLIEHQMRQEEGREGFRLDNCLVAMKICFQAKQDRMLQLEAERYYDYE